MKPPPSSPRRAPRLRHLLLLALTIGLVELTASARSIQEFSFQVFEAFTAATLIYLFLNLIVVTGMRWLERRVEIPGLLGAGQAMPQAGH